MSPPRAANTTAILLAAGDSTRMGGDKMNLPYKGTTLFRRAVAPIVDCPLIHELVVVVRPDARCLVENVDCTVVLNHQWQEGMGASLRLGVAASAANADTLLVCLADMPEISAGLLTELIGAFERCGKSSLTPFCPFCEGRSGHPVVFDAVWRPQLERLSGDVGARHLLRASPDAVAHFETTDRAVLFDVDRPEDLCLRQIRTHNAEHASTVVAELEKQHIYHTARPTDDGDVGAIAAIEYHVFDEERVAEICSSLEGGDA